jgi:hypothetical protein
MDFKGTLRKMNSELNSEVHYSLNLNSSPVYELNKVLGKAFFMAWTGKIFCINCGRSIRKTYGQGFCFTCFTEAPQAAPCIMRPELCEAHEGKGRDVEWEEAHHNQPHVVYLAQTSGIKVGVTRATQVPTRWIDQGARSVVIIARVPYRKMAGDIEVEMKQYLSDRTDWRKMLTNESDPDDLLRVRDRILSFFPAPLIHYALPEEPLYRLEYPVLEYPNRIEVHKLEDAPLNGVLTGIRGQYLYIDRESVINVRKYSGYEVEVRV